ncbi:MAG: PrgI family protein [Patescibacteria group bacterium]|nr:PrgI family protein [Patescibacteria group bacterium]
MSAKIPQNVTIEDKLVGPLTLKQFLYLLGGGAVIFIAYQYYTRAYLYFIEFLAITVVVGFFVLAMAFLKINGRPFGVFLLSLFKFVMAPRIRTWSKEPRRHVKAIRVRGEDIKTTKEEIAERRSPGEFKTQIEKLANILDTGGKMNENDADAITTQVAHIDAPVIEPEQSLGVEDVLEDVE